MSEKLSDRAIALVALGIAVVTLCATMLAIGVAAFAMIPDWIEFIARVSRAQ